jgi:localization factor PodJL
MQVRRTGGKDWPTTESEMGVLMSNRRTYLETLNQGRERRPSASLEQITQSLQNLESRLEQSREQHDPMARPRADLDRRQGPRADLGFGPPPAPAERMPPRNDLGFGPRHGDDLRAAPPRPAPRTAPPEQPYQSIARDIDRVRGQEDGIASVSKIASELKALRDDLRQQMQTGLHQEFEQLKSEIGRVYSSAPAQLGAELSTEIERISDSLHALSNRSDDRGIALLRQEIEQVKGALQHLAREETVQSADRRWDEFDRRWSDFEDRVDARQQAGDPSISILADRLQSISEAVNGLPESLSLRSMEDKVRMLAGAVEQFVRQQERQAPETFSLIEERLDEISRAIVASSAAAKTPNFDPEPFRRIEARISSLATQIEEVANDRPLDAVIEHLNLLSRRVDELATKDPTPDPAVERLGRQINSLAAQLKDVANDRPTQAVIEHLNHLSRRVDELAARAPTPDPAVERLARQIGSIADKIDRQPTPPDPELLFQGIEQRFDVLSDMIERRQGDAIEQGNGMFRELEHRLEQLGARLDKRAADPLDNNRVMAAIDARFSAFAERMEANNPAEANNAAIRGLESRLVDISHRLDASAAQFAEFDPEVIRNLESQVAALTQHLSRPAAPLPEFEDIGPRLDELERSIAGSRDSILEAARQAAENAVRTFDGSQTQTAAVTGLAQDMRALEQLTRRSDQRNAKTFEAIHDTLIKIVDRLGALDTSDAGQDEPDLVDAPAPVMQRSPAPKLEIADVPSIDPDQRLRRGEPEERLERAGPSMDRMPAAPVAETAVLAAKVQPDAANAAPARGPKALIGGIARALSAKRDSTAIPAAAVEARTEAMEPKLDLDQPLDPRSANRPLEPGTGAPDLNAIMRRVRDEREQPQKASEPDAAQSDFIAAARRAAKAAAAEAESLKRGSDKSGLVRSTKLGDVFRSRRKPILMAAAAVMIALAGLQLGKAFLGSKEDVAEALPDPSTAAPPIAASTMAEPTDTAVKDVTAQASLPTDPMMSSAEPAPEAANQTPLPEDSEAAAEAAAPDAPATASAEPAPAEIAPDTQITSANAPTDTAATPIPTAAPAADAAAPAVDTTVPATEAAAPAEPAPPADKMAEIPTEAGPVALREAAASGDAKALFEVGSRFAEGRGMTADMKQAATWYEKSADLGFAPAQYRIGNFFEKGTGVERDIAKAKTWYEKAATQGNASAMHNLAVLYAMGADGAADNEAAARWFTAAAEVGVKDSQFNLGILAAKGVGMKQSLEESYKWFALVAKEGDRDAAAKRDEIANSLRPEQLKAARASVELWKPKPLNAEANSVEIPDSWQESQATTAGIDMKKAIGNIQRILNKNGYDAGGADGVMGEKTKTAIMAFQKDNGMEANGLVDETLVRALIAKK